MVHVALLGAVLGSAMDGFHTFGGVTWYRHEWLLGMAWFTPLVFAGAYLATGLVFVGLRRFDARPFPSRPRRVASLAIFTAIYAFTGLAPVSSLAKLAVSTLGAVGLWWWTGRSVASLVTGAVAAAVGPSLEALLVATGAFSHRAPDVAGIPVWLFGLYFASGSGLAPFLGALLLPNPWPPEPRKSGTAVVRTAP